MVSFSLFMYFSIWNGTARNKAAPSRQRNSCPSPAPCSIPHSSRPPNRIYDKYVTDHCAKNAFFPLLRQHSHTIRGFTRKCTHSWYKVSSVSWKKRNMEARVPTRLLMQSLPRRMGSPITFPAAKRAMLSIVKFVRNQMSAYSTYPTYTLLT